MINYLKQIDYEDITENNIVDKQYVFRKSNSEKCKRVLFGELPAELLDIINHNDTHIVTLPFCQYNGIGYTVDDISLNDMKLALYENKRIFLYDCYDTQFKNFRGLIFSK
jgi:hypothetical protein